LQVDWDTFLALDLQNFTSGTLTSGLADCSLALRGERTT